jgi:hypothetical protein
MLYDMVILPIKEFFDALDGAGRSVLYTLLAAAGALGFALGRSRAPSRDRYRTFGGWRFPSFQNTGEELVSRVLLAQFRPPDYHLMNHVTLRIGSGTTQVDHILVSRFGVFVIETKDYNGWIFATESDAKWTSVHYRLKYRFQNPVRQNFRHVVAVQALLDFVPRDAIKSVVVFCGTAEFKTDVPPGVVHVDELVPYLARHTVELMALNHLQYAVGRLETARLTLSGKTDVEHVQSLRRRFGGDRQ